MSVHLLLITLGPVQDFIAQARRTRDLWYGSHLLSELSRAAARALVEEGAHLIFPALGSSHPELEECHEPLREGTGEPPLNVANKLLAEVPGHVDPAELARTVREAVAAYWRHEVTTPVKAKCTGLLAPDIDEVWNEQVDSLLEFAASWLPLGEYKETRIRLEEATSARKLLRDFEPWRHGRGGVPKSSLDGARETVLLPPKQRPRDLVRRYRIADGEQLDAVGLVKRAGGEPGQFVPVVNVALSAWLSHADRAAPGELERLREACREARISRVTRTDLRCVGSSFPFDASVLLPGRWRSVFEELGVEEQVAREWGHRYVQPLLKKAGEPYPYVACLVADGDRMGRAIDELASAEAHRTFSQRLARFASEARKIVEQEHRGVLVYAGGDDVLAFLPLPDALRCADALRRVFQETMVEACGALGDELRPTLSVGIGIGHVMESMGDLLELGRRAEHDAKRDRNALGIIVDKRSGGTCTWRATWDEDPVAALEASEELLESRLPSRKVYEVAAIVRGLPEPSAEHGNEWAHVLAYEVRGVLSRVEGGGVRAEDAGLVLDPEIGYAALHYRVQAWVERLLIARTFARAALGGRRRSEEAAA